MTQVPDSLGLNKMIRLDSTSEVVVMKEFQDTSDSKKTKQHKPIFGDFFSKNYPDPGKAALLSIIPGGGQLYNKKLAYIKLPIIYGGLTWLVILANDNTRIYNSFKEAHLKELRGEEHEYPLADENTLKQYRDIYDKRRQQTYIAIGAVYALNIVEAYVTAHLLNFDVDEDLSFRIKPSFTPIGNAQQFASLGIQFEF
ncbi:MAG: DUF5683 domain-containing protein [Saprospiraceae bacterium]